MGANWCVILSFFGMFCVGIVQHQYGLFCHREGAGVSKVWLFCEWCGVGERFLAEVS